MKKAIASTSAAIHIRINPNPTIMINAAPISSSNPVVPNKPTFDFAETCFSERLVKKAAIIANIHTTAITKNIPAMNGNMSLGVTFAVLGVKP